VAKICEEMQGREGKRREGRKGRAGGGEREESFVCSFAPYLIAVRRNNFSVL
jgi:hypothetical protein